MPAPVAWLNRLLEGQWRPTAQPLPALLRLSRARDGEMRRVDLAHALVPVPSGVTRLLTHLEHDGHVAQGKSDKDGRVRSAVITEKGRARHAQATPLHTGAIQMLLGQRYSDEELAILSDLFARLDVAPGDRSFSG